jgi:glutamate-5-semialdehyde dehydrogenase
MAAAELAGTDASLLDRLLLTESRIADIASALKQLKDERDPIGEVLEGRTITGGLKMTKLRVPLGVVAMIYEARPNVTADAAGLCIKTANACILRGGSLALNTNIVMCEILAKASEDAGLPKGSIQGITTKDREATSALMSLHGLVDVLIPRGSASLINACVKNSKVPVIETGTGNCHVYVHACANQDNAVPIILNAKLQRPGVCNACESVIVDKDIADVFVPRIVGELAKNDVKIHIDDVGKSLLSGSELANYEGLLDASEEDWATEYLALEISIKVVSGLDEGINHVNHYGSKHSEAIITEDFASAMRFTNEVDASTVYVNASTRFTDGAQFGLGAEIGISTQKLHARGPMGLDALTSTKFIVLGKGQIRE